MTDLVQNRYLGSSRKYLGSFIFPLPLKLRVVHIRKKISIFSKMAPTMIKFCGLIIHSEPNYMVLSVFPEKTLKLKKILFKFFKPRNLGPKPNGQSHSNSILGSPCIPFFHFRLTVKNKGGSHKKKLHISIPSKMAPTILIKFCGFISSYIRNPQHNTIDISRKIPETRKIFFLFSVWPSSNIAPKPTDQSRSNPLSRVLLQIFLGGFFRFRSTLTIMGSFI